MATATKPKPAPAKRTVSNPSQKVKKQAWGEKNVPSTEDQYAEAKAAGGINHEAYRVLKALSTGKGKATKPRELTSGELKEASGVRYNLYWYLTGTMEQGQRWPLIQLGWVQVEKDASEDSRQQSYNLTPKGLDVLRNGLDEKQQAKILARFKQLRPTPKGSKGK